MSSNWISPLEMCAAGGVLDYDAAADLLDMPQRFVGNPSIGDVPAIDRPLLLPPNTKIRGGLQEDSYESTERFIKNPSWKKWLFGGIVAVGTLALLLSGKGKKVSMPKLSKIKMPDFSKLGTSIKNFGKTVWSYIKKPFVYIAGKLK